MDRHWLTHYPAQPWCEVCIRAKANDFAHLRRNRKEALTPLIQFDYGDAGLEGEKDHMEFVVGSDMCTGSIRASAVRWKGKGDSYAINSAVSWLSELGWATQKSSCKQGDRQRLRLCIA